MKNLIKTVFALTLIGAALFYLKIDSGYASKRAGCEAYIYVANNSVFECRLQIDGVPQVGSMLPSKVKVFTTELPNDAPKRIKVKIIYDDPDYIEPKSYIMITHKLECGLTDSIYIAHTK